jgi:hypothetical protein
MPLLSDDPIPSRRTNGKVGEKFVRIFRSLDEEDRAKVRRWYEDGLGITFIHAKINQHFDVSYTTTERGLWRLEESAWEC